jgi:hypothetical protein
VLPKIVLIALPAVVVVEEGVHVPELVGHFGRRLSRPVVVEPPISVGPVFPCFYQLAENAPYIFVEVFCQFLFSSSTEHPTPPPYTLCALLRASGPDAWALPQLLGGRCERSRGSDRTPPCTEVRIARSDQVVLDRGRVPERLSRSRASILRRSSGMSLPGASTNVDKASEADGWCEGLLR